MRHEISWRIERYDEVSSTNDIAYERALAGETEGLVVVADSQTKGRGRLGRAWFSPAGKNIYLSILLKPDEEKVGVIPFVCGLATNDAFKKFGLETKLKWPNDVVVNEKKIGGILCEYRGEGLVIAGIGVNINTSESEFPEDIKSLATSYLIEAKRELNRDEFVESFLTFFKLWYIKPHFEVVKEAKRRCVTLKRRVKVLLSTCAIEGVACDMDEKGALLIQTNAGLVRIETGDVIHVR